MLTTLRPHAIVGLALLAAACGRDDAARTPAPSAAQLDKQAIDAATERERGYQAALGKGNLPFLDGCAPNSVDAIRLVDIGTGGSQGYSLAIVPDPRGAVAIWQGIQHVGGGKYSAYGPNGMRMDGNGWRQVRQSLVEPDFALGAEPVAEPARVQRAYPATFIAWCVDGAAFLVAEPTSPDERFAFERTAVAMRRLAGNYYSPPAR
jgi:hypothetical protein